MTLFGHIGRAARGSRDSSQHSPSYLIRLSFLPLGTGRVVVRGLIKSNLDVPSFVGFLSTLYIKQANVIQSDLLKHLSLDVLYEKCVLRPKHHQYCCLKHYLICLPGISCPLKSYGLIWTVEEF